MTFLDTLKSKCDCCIIETLLTPYAGFTYAGVYIDRKEIFWYDGGIIPQIRIDKTIPESEKEGTLAHEMGHRWRHKRKGENWRSPTPIRTEIIAELYALHLLLRNKRKEAILGRFLRHKVGWSGFPYEEALAIIKSRRIYKRCQEFVNLKEK